jgi:hypothetical protein
MHHLTFGHHIYQRLSTPALKHHQEDLGVVRREQPRQRQVLLTSMQYGSN